MNPPDKLERLKTIIAEAGSAIIALSGGTDSTFLVSVAAGIPDFRLMAVTVSTPYMFSSEINDALLFCQKMGVKHKELRMEIPASVLYNPPDRCYLCKKEIMKLIKTAALEGEYAFIFDGTNADDLQEHRPGLRALREESVRSPLADAGLSKAEIRLLAGEAGLEVSNKPSNTCLLTRFPHDTAITPDDLKRAEEAEQALEDEGFPGARARVHGDLVRIELRGDQFERVIGSAIREKLSVAIKQLGFRYVTIEVTGYRTGSMNKTNEE